jgi:PKD repeat protein
MESDVEQSQVLTQFIDQQTIDSAAPLGSGAAGVTIPPVHVQNVIKTITEEVSPQNIKNYLLKLQGFGSRLYRAPGMFNASIWLHDVLKGNGRLEVAYHNFTVIRPTWGTFVLSNVILTLPGVNTSSDQIYYMYAHSDAVQMTDSSKWLTNTPGADDDASGCAAVLEAARVLSRYKFHDTIKFAFFQAEEIGLVGSYYYTENMTKWGENVSGGIDYDMIGYSSGTKEYDLRFRYNSASAWQGEYMVDANDRYNTELSIQSILQTSSIPSDIQRFYNRGFPSVFGIEYEFSPYYHTTSDLVKYLNISLIDKCTRLATASLSEMARLIYTDLSIPPGNLTVSNSEPTEGENVTIDVTVYNNGNLAADDFDVVFYSDGSEISRSRISVPANGTNTTSSYWNASVGSHNITAVLDPINEIVESDETNNSAWIRLDCNDIPKAILSATPMTALTNEIIFFNGSLSTDLIGGITEYNFSFGDGNYTGWITNSSVSHSYSENDHYLASLIVRDSMGAISIEANLTITILNRKPHASPWSNLTRANTLVPIQFYSEAFDIDGIVTTAWAFGDGDGSTTSNPIHSYSQSGIYDVKLTIQDDDGAGGTYILKLIIDNRPPSCSIEVNSLTGNITSKFSFNANASDLDGTIRDYYWDLGDGTVFTTQTVNHIFTEPGKYYIRLKVVDYEGAKAESYVTITIADLPPVAIASVSTTEPKTSEKLFFNGVDSYDLEGFLFYHWDFGDGNSSNLVSPVHLYTLPGSYEPTLTVTDLARQSAMVNLNTIAVENRPPVAKFRFFGDFYVNNTIYFDGTDSFDPEGPIYYSWNFDDGSSGTGKVVGHIFSEPGNYTVILTVTDEHGFWSTVDHLINIKVEKIPSNSKTEPDPNEKEVLEATLWGLNILWIIVIILLISFLIYRNRKQLRKTPESPQEPVTSQPESEPTDNQYFQPQAQPQINYETPPSRDGSDVMDKQEIPAITGNPMPSHTPVAQLVSPSDGSVPQAYTPGSVQPPSPAQPVPYPTLAPAQNSQTPPALPPASND